MNSKQRRTNKRYWRHQVELPDDITFEHYLEIRTWCRKHFGKIGYRWGNAMDYATFDFRNDKDYVLFMLKWL